MFIDAYIAVKDKKVVASSNPIWEIQNAEKKLSVEAAMKKLGKKRKSKRVYDYLEDMKNSLHFDIHQKYARRLKNKGTVYRGGLSGNGLFKGKRVIFDRKYILSSGQYMSYIYDEKPFE